ncbi:acetylxylan esterase [bacterium]|nr:acetylxylan esterase [bacterium]
MSQSSQALSGLRLFLVGCFTFIIFQSFSLAASSDASRPLNERLDRKVYEVPAMHSHPSHDVGEIKAVFYDSVPYQGKRKRVFAYVGIPESDEPVPAMVLVHGGGGTAFHKWVKIWNDRGYAAIAMDLEGHLPENVASGGGRLSHDHSGPSRVGRFGDAEQSLEEQWMYHAVSDIFTAQTLLASLPEVDANRIGVTGISWGGILSSLVSGIDARYKCAMPVYGAGYLYESLGHFKSVSGEAQKYWDPARHFENGSVPTLWVNSDIDGHFSINITSRSFETTSDHALMSIHPGMGHGHGAGWDPKRVPEIYAFADFFLKGEGSTPPRIVKQPSGRKVKLAYQSEAAVESATVYYLNESLTYQKPADQPKAKHSRPGEWLTLEAKVNQGKNTVQANLPPSCMTYYVNLKDSRGLISTSVLVELPPEDELYEGRGSAFSNPKKDNPHLPNVLLIGDSISIGYTPYVRELMMGQADVYRIPSNTKYSAFGLENLDKWLAMTPAKWDVIHFNWGLWDLCYRHPKSKVQGKRDKVNGTLTATPEQYRATMEKIVARLKETDATLIWCATTPVPEGEVGRKLGDDLIYNRAAEDIMKANGVLVNDLHKHALLKLPAIMVREGDVHFTEEGYRHLAEKVAAEITTALDK